MKIRWQREDVRARGRDSGSVEVANCPVHNAMEKRGIYSFNALKVGRAAVRSLGTQEEEGNARKHVENCVCVTGGGNCGDDWKKKLTWLAGLCVPMKLVRADLSGHKGRQRHRCCSCGALAMGSGITP